jgi:single-stranded-DNA-specific exonuclease
MNEAGILQGMKYRWEKKLTDTNKKEKQDISLHFNLLYPIASILFDRGYTTKNAVRDFLFPVSDKFLHDGSLLKDANEAVLRIEKAIASQEKILIIGDYDVDGVTSTALLFLALEGLCPNLNFFLPHRIKHGYGLSEYIVNQAKENSYSLIITVDNGTSAYEALSLAKNYNIDVIVTDHHKPQKMPEGALCLVNPHQHDCRYPFKGLAGVGVIFKVVSLLYQKKKMVLPDECYELFLIGTIADLVPLTDENRFLIKDIFEKVKKKRSKAFSVLASNVGIEDISELSSQDIAFSLAPQINALGRLSDPRNGVLFFTKKDAASIEAIGKQLLAFNKKRKHIERRYTKEILEDISRSNIDYRQKGCLIKVSKEFPPGIVGIIAARLTQEFTLPSCVLVETEGGVLKGSCRSIPSCNIFDILFSMKDKLLSFGGHSAAAGVSLEKEHFNLFETELSKGILSVCQSSDFEPSIAIDALIDIDDIAAKLVDDISLLEPFGASNSSPVFCIEEIFIDSFFVMKEVHIKIVLASYKKKISIVFFNRRDIILAVKKNSPVSIVGKITENKYKGKKSIEMIGIDIAFL